MRVYVRMYVCGVQGCRLDAQIATVMGNEMENNIAGAFIYRGVHS